MSDTPSPNLIVTCAIIHQKGRVLCTQRSEEMSLPLKWEFPGGKLEPGEDPGECVVREIEEELSLHIEVEAEAPTVFHPYREGMVMKLLPYIAVVASGGMHLNEHADARWCTPEEMQNLDWAGADIEVLQWWLANGKDFG